MCSSDLGVLAYADLVECSARANAGTHDPDERSPNRADEHDKSDGQDQYGPGVARTVSYREVHGVRIASCMVFWPPDGGVTVSVSTWIVVGSGQVPGLPSSAVKLTE